MSEADISVSRDGERVLVRFAAIGSRPLHRPEIEIVSDGMPHVCAGMPPVLSGSDKPLEVMLSICPGGRIRR